jgi:hypothetical protein
MAHTGIASPFPSVNGSQRQMGGGLAQPEMGLLG